MTVGPAASPALKCPGLGRYRPVLSTFPTSGRQDTICRSLPLVLGVAQGALGEGDGLGLSDGLARRVASEIGLGLTVGLPRGPNPELSGVSVTP
jgi:hypothetical protein